METKRRSIVKALSWRACATIITTGVVFWATGKIDFAMEIGVIDTAIKVFIYFMHERIWVNIKYGKVEPRDYQI